MGGIPFDNPAKSAPRQYNKKERKERKKAEEKVSKNVFGKLLVTLQVILSVVFLWFIMSIGVLPMKFFAMAVGVVLLLFLLIFWSQKGKIGWRILGKLFCLIFILVLGISDFYLWKTDTAMNQMTGTDENSNSTSIMGKNFSITEDCFSIYMNGYYEDSISSESSNRYHMIATINPETKQVLLVKIPKEYYVLLPEISDGKKDILENAESYGIDVAATALGRLYNTEIRFYIQADLKSIKEAVAMVDVTNPLELFEDTVKMFDNASDYMHTNMSKEQIQELFKMQLSSSGEWNKHPVTAEGTSEQNSTYTAPDKMSHVLQPREDSVKRVQDLIERVNDGEKITRNP